MTTLYYYRILGQEFGPVPLEGVQQLVASGQLGSRDEIRLDGEPNWQLVESTAELTPQASSSDFADFLPPSAAESVPDRLSQCYCESLGQTLGPMLLSDLIELVHQGDIGGEDRVKIGESGKWEAAKDIAELSELFVDDFELSSSVDQAAQVAPSPVVEKPRKPVVNVPATAPPQQAAPPPIQAQAAVPEVQISRWFVNVLGNEYGPVDMAGMKSWVEQGRLAHDSEVRRENDTHWIRADTVDGLFDVSSQSTTDAAGDAMDAFLDEVLSEPESPTSTATAQPATPTSPADSTSPTAARSSADSSEQPASTASILAQHVPRPPIVAKPAVRRVAFGDQIKENLQKPVVQGGLVLIVLFLLWTVFPLITRLFSPSDKSVYDRLLAIRGELSQLREAGNEAATESFAKGVLSEVKGIGDQLKNAGAGVDQPIQQHLFFAAAHDLLPILEKPNSTDEELEDEFDHNMAIAQRLMNGSTFDEAVAAEEKKRESDE
ncbi:MAG: GYF domain-containing protein [Planctomycetota bacterium]|nr:GYF domain-containing protein [Planctomycetota bacterium]